MKNFITGFLFLGLLIPSHGFSQIDTLLKPGVVNMAVLVLDYESKDFEEGNLFYYSCTTCPTDSLALDVVFKSPGDFGWIKFFLDSPNLQVFYGGIVWMGTGQIHYPASFSSAYPFDHAENIAPKPDKITYYDWDGEITNDSLFVIDADSALETILPLTITNAFSKHNYSAGVYLYPPTVGAFNPSVAKWVVFLYANDVTTSVKEQASLSGVKVYPNPAQHKLFISQKSSQNILSKYKITDSSGRILQVGELKTGETEIDISALPKGLHLIRVEDVEGSFTVQKILKQ